MNIHAIKHGTSNFRSIFDTVTDDWNNKYIFRSDNLAEVESFNNGEKELYIIDVRSFNELEKSAYQPKDKHTHYLHMPLYGEADSIGHSPGKLEQFKHLGDMYVYMVKNYSPQIKVILETIMTKRDSNVIIHCTSGKDRTGIIAMLLLEILSVPSEAILESYSYSAANMSEKYTLLLETATEAGIQLPEYLLKSNIEDLIYLYDYLTGTYGSVEDYINSLALDSTLIHDYQHYVKGD